jgi:hypothetical protein
MANQSALLQHLVSRIEQDVQFLAEQNLISAQDAQAIVARLPGAAAAPMAMPTAPSAVPASAAPPPTYAGKQTKQARALWAYNEKNSVRGLHVFRFSDYVRLLIAAFPGP